MRQEEREEKMRQEWEKSRWIKFTRKEKLKHGTGRANMGRWNKENKNKRRGEEMRKKHDETKLDNLRIDEKK